MPQFLLLLLLITPSLFAASPVWQVQKGQHKLYLGGTVHLLRAEDFPLPTSFDEAYHQSEQLVFETDIGATQTPLFQRKMLMAGRLPDGQSLSRLIQPETARQLDTYLRQQGMQISMFEGLRPFMVSLSLTIAELKKLGAGNTGVDLHYYLRAKRDGKPVSGLETPDQQLEFLAHMADGEEDLVILQTLEELKTLPQLFRDLIDSWRSGDLDRMQTLFVDTMRGEFDPVYQRLLVDRNNNWMPRIEALLRDAPVELVLVGTAHLAGPDGLIQLLQSRGYVIRQLD